MRSFFCLIVSGFLISLACKAQTNWDPEQHAVIVSERGDGRFTSSYAIVHQLVKNTRPSLSFHSEMRPEEMPVWQSEVRQTMMKLMAFPDYLPEKKPICVSQEKRDGYTLEKWEFYPLPQALSTFLVLRPNHLSKTVAAVLCIPGSGMSKEGLAGEPGISEKLNDNYTSEKVSMALNFVRKGYIAVAVDNPASGEASDLEMYTRGRQYDYEVVSRMLLEIGWSYLGYTSWLDMQVLDWMKQDPDIRKDRIIVSGFSLGTEPLMVLGVLDPSIYAFVYNDFLCQTQERAIVMTKPTEKGYRPFPNSIRHLIPGFWHYFNFPDLVAALAPRPLILTEGGLDRDLELVRKAYSLSGHPENVEIHHYEKYADPALRHFVSVLPEGLDRDTYFQMVNVDGTNHYFKNEFIFKWLDQLFLDL